MNPFSLICASLVISQVANAIPIARPKADVMVGTVFTTVTSYVDDDVPATVAPVSLIQNKNVAAPSPAAATTATPAPAPSSAAASSKPAAAPAPASSSPPPSSAGSNAKWSDLPASATKGLQPAEATAKAASIQMKNFDITSVDGDLQDFVNPTQEFKDDTIPCSQFPVGQGVVPVPWIGYGGWSSIQQNVEGGAPFSACVEGALCSYACQAGMSKTQWPEQQPSDKESRGGLLCVNGKLRRTNQRSKFLCEWGKNTNNAVSKLKSVISLCRTDYPGSEGMYVPTRLMPGKTKPMSVVLEDNYYKWNGGITSSQYYVNNAGLDVDKGCIWGNSDKPIGNWAPVVLGSGYTQDKTWLSIIPNPENKQANQLNFNVEIQAVGSAQLSATCYIKDGAFSGSQGAATDGCTVAVTGGTANFVFTDRA